MFYMLACFLSVALTFKFGKKTDRLRYIWLHEENIQKFADMLLECSASVNAQEEDGI